MEPRQVGRRLTTILAADVVGYSRLMAADEAGTLALLKSLRQELFAPKAAEYHGRVVKLMGDGTLMEFASVVDAVGFAADVQHAMASRNAGVPEDRRITYRIGINIGDVIVEDDDIFGDGVNVAARLEKLAEPGGICVSRTVVNHVGAKVALRFQDLGDKRVKNIVEPVRIFKVLLDPPAADSGRIAGVAARRSRRKPAAVVGFAVLAAAASLVLWPRPWEPRKETAAVEDMAFPLPDKPSLAVLPFANMSPDPHQEYFADGMTDDLITDLSKVSGLFVIARNSTFAFKGRAVETRRVAEDLGVRYVLEGSVRRAGDTVRVNAQLIDATTGGHVWADRYDGTVTDIFAVQDAFVQAIVAALALNLSDGEHDAIAGGQTNNVHAFEAFQKGWAHYLRFTPEDNAKAADYLKRAAELDPEYGRAYSALGLVYVRGCQWRWHAELNTSAALANAVAQQYLDEGEKRASSLTRVAASQIHLYNKRHDQAFTEAARAVALDPNDPEAHVAMALAMITTGRPDAGLEFVQTALRLNPNHPNHYVLAHAMAYFSLNDLERTATVLSEALERDTGAVELAPLLAAALARLGRREAARNALLLRQPDASDAELESVYHTYHFPYSWSYREREVRTRLVDGLYLAGLPLDVTVESLASSVTRDDVQGRRAAAQTLGRFGPSAAEAVPALVEVLADRDRWVRINALRALGKIGPAAAAAVPALEAIEKDVEIGSFATRALRDIRGY